MSPKKLYCGERLKAHKNQKNLFLSEPLRSCLFFNRSYYGKSAIVIMDQQLLLCNSGAFCIILPFPLFFLRRRITHKYFNFQFLKDEEQQWNAEVFKSTNCSTPKKISKESVFWTVQDTNATQMFRGTWLWSPHIIFCFFHLLVEMYERLLILLRTIAEALQSHIYRGRFFHFTCYNFLLVVSDKNVIIVIIKCVDNRIFGP